MAVRQIALDSKQAWAAAIAAALANGMAFGTAYTFGTFFESMADEFGSERGSTALLFGVTLLFFFGFGAVSGPLSDRFGHQRLFVIGGVMFVGGITLTSHVDSVTAGYLTYGVGVGVGGGCFIAPLTALVGQLFGAGRALALGVLATGNGVGTLVLSPLSESLIEHDGWRSAYRTLAIVAAVIFLLALPAVSVTAARHDVPAPGGSTGRAGRYAFVSTPGFRALFVSALLMSVGLFVAFAFIVPFATDAGVGSSAASRLVAIIGLTSIAGRLTLTSATKRFGVTRVYQATLAVQPVAYAIWLAAGGSYPMLVLFAAVLGVSYGGFVAISPAMLIEQAGMDSLGRKMGTLFLSFGIGGMIGPPMAGAVADATSGRAAPILLSIAILLVALWSTLPLRAGHLAPGAR